MVYTIEVPRETDARWIAEVLALHVVAGRIEHGAAAQNGGRHDLRRGARRDRGGHQGVDRDCRRAGPGDPRTHATLTPGGPPCLDPTAPAPEPAVYKVPLVLTPHPEGGFTVTSPVLPELVTEGDTVDEALGNVDDALATVLELYEDMSKPLPVNLRQDAGGREPVWFEHLVKCA